MLPIQSLLHGDKREGKAGGGRGKLGWEGEAGGLDRVGGEG